MFTDPLYLCGQIWYLSHIRQRPTKSKKKKRRTEKRNNKEKLFRLPFFMGDNFSYSPTIKSE